MKLKHVCGVVSKRYYRSQRSSLKRFDLNTNDQPLQVKGSLPLEEGVIMSSTTGRGA
jgi:hypothetical protein